MTEKKETKKVSFWMKVIGVILYTVLVATGSKNAEIISKVWTDGTEVVKTSEAEDAAK